MSPSDLNTSARQLPCLHIHIPRRPCAATARPLGASPLQVQPIWPGQYCLAGRAAAVPCAYNLPTAGLHVLHATYTWHPLSPHYLPPTRYTQSYLAIGPQQEILSTTCMPQASLKCNGSLAASKTQDSYRLPASECSRTVKAVELHLSSLQLL